MSDDTTDELDVDAQKERLYDEYGKPAKRDEPLDLEVDNLVFVCAVGGGLFSTELGRVMKTGLSYNYVNRKVPDEGFKHDEEATYVNVRTGTSMQNSVYVPERYVVEVVADVAKWDKEKHQYVPSNGVSSRR